MDSKKLQRIGLDTLPVTFVDTTDTSPNYFDVIYIPPRFTSGKNLIKLKGNSSTLLSKADVFVEVLDAVNNALYFEVLDYQDDDGTVCIQVTIDENTAPGNCTIYIATRAINIPELGLYNIPSGPGSNIKWIRSLAISPGTLNNNEILFVSGSLPKVDIKESISPYFGQSYKQDRLMEVSSSSTVKLIVPGTTKKSLKRVSTTTGQNRVGPNYLYKVIQPNPIISSTRGSAISTMPIVIQDNTLPTLKITSGNFVFSSSMVGGAITVNNPIIDTVDGTIAANTTYNTIIVNVLNETTAHVADDLQFVYNSRGIREFSSTPFTCSYVDNPIYTPSENYQSYIDVDIHNILPSTGNVYKIRAYMKPVGSAGEYRMINETVLTQQDMLVDTGSLTGENKIGEFESLSDITTYWSSSLSGSDNVFPVYDSNYNIKSTNLKVTYGRSILNDSMQLNSLASYTQGDFAVVKLKDTYFPKFYKNDKYVVALNASVVQDSIFKTTKAPTTQVKVPDGWVDVYMSGSAFDSNITLTADNIQTTALGKYVGSVYINDGAIILDKAFSFEADQDGTGTVLFAVRSGNVYLSNIHVYPDTALGYSPSRIRLRLPVPTISINAEQQFKFQYFDYQGNPADYETEVFGPVFAGGNTYIEGDQNVLTGSLSVGGGIGKGLDLNGDIDYGWLGLHGYDGFDNAVSGAGDPGVALWSGSRTLNPTSYAGIGFELASDSAWLKFKAGAGQSSSLDIKGNTIIADQFINSNGFVITSSYWTGSTDGSISRLSNVKVTGSLYVTGSSNFIGLHTITGSSVFNGTVRLDPTTDPGSTALSSSFLFVSQSNTSLGYDMYVRQDGNIVKWKWIEANLNTGILYGGVLTYSGSEFYISPGTGIIVNHNATTGSEVNPQIQYVNWNSITQSIALGSQNSYVYIDAAGVAHQQTSFFTAQQYHYVLPIGRISHYGANSTTITGVGNNVLTAYDQSSQTSQFIRAFGPLKLNGFAVTANAGTLGFALTSGVAFNLGGYYQYTPDNPSTYTSNAQATSSIIRISRSGSGFNFDNNAGSYYTAIDPTKWDDGTGTLASVGNSEWTIQRVFVNPVSGRSHIYYSQTAPYTTLQNALQSLATDTFTESEVTINAYVFAAYLIVRGNTTDLSDTANNTILSAGLFRNTSGGGGGGAATNLDDLTDVNITSPTNGQSIIYQTGLWINGYPTTSSYSVTASHATSGTGKFSGSFSGSFQGNGSNLTDIPVTALTGYNPYRIASGSATASISPNRGLEINTNTFITGSLYVTGTGSVGSARAVLGVASITSSLTVWDTNYTTPHPIASLPGMSATDSALVSIVNTKSYGGVPDDDYTQFLNHLTVSATSSDNETIYLQQNYLDLSFANTQSGGVYNTNNTITVRTGSNITFLYNGFNSTLVSESANVGTGYGLFNTIAANSGTISTAYGIQTTVASRVSSSIDNAIGIQINNNGITWGRIRNAYGLILNTSMTTNASMSNYAGVTVVGNATGSDSNALLMLGTIAFPTGSWAIYNTSSFQNYLRGWVGINKPIPSTQLDIIGDVYVTGSIQVTNSVTASLFGTASYATQALTSSYAVTSSYVVSSSYALTSSYALLAATASYVITASYAQTALTSSYAITSSFANTATTASYVLSASFATTASYYDEKDPVFTAKSGSYVVTSSFNSFTGSYNTGSFTGSFSGDGTNIINVVTSSYSISSSFTLNAISSSYAVTASHATSGTGLFSGSFSGSFQGNGANLTNIPVTALTGFDPSRIVSGSVTASVSPAAGFVVNAQATITGSLSNGDDAIASGTYSHAEGQHTLASDLAAHSEGYYTTASGQYSHAEGATTRASGLGAHAEGQETFAANNYAHTEGFRTYANGGAAHAEGRTTSASANYSHAEGYDTKTLGDYSHTEGLRSIATGLYSHAEGMDTYTFGTASHAEGRQTSASGNWSHAEGFATTASAAYSHTEGNRTLASNSYAHAEGDVTIAVGISSHAEGSATIASGSYSHAEGNLTLAIGAQSHAEGYLTTASAASSHAEGYLTNAAAAYSHAEGGETIAAGTYAHAEGRFTYASGSFSHAEGRSTLTIGQYSHAEGYLTSASANYSHAEGLQTRASGLQSHAEGEGSIADNQAAHAEGANTYAGGIASHTEGYFTTASGTYSHAEGYQTTTLLIAAHAEGYRTVASGSYSHAEGNGSISSGSYSHAEGNGTLASNTYAHSEGRLTVASGQYSHAEGNTTIASGSGAHAEGEITLAQGASSHTEGYRTTASAAYAHAEGQSTLASGQGSHAEGGSTITVGQYSHAEGGSTWAINEGAHTEGYQTTGSGNYSHAEGHGTLTAALASHAEGYQTTASGSYSHAEGYQTVARAVASHAEGIGTIASGSYQHVQGRYNTHGDSTSLFIIGNGTDDSNRSDIFKVGTLNSHFMGTGSLIVTGSINALQNVSASRAILSGSTGTQSGSILTVIGSGSTQSVFRVQGSQGELFAVTDTLSGSLFSVNNISGLPIVEVFSDDSIVMGSYLAPALNTTKRQILAVGNNVIYNVPTASYDAAWFEYVIKSGSSARAGSITAIWSGSSVNFTETTTTDFGSTAGVNFTVIITGSNMALTGSATTANWTLKTIIRTI